MVEASVQRVCEVCAGKGFVRLLVGIVALCPHCHYPYLPIWRVEAS